MAIRFRNSCSIRQLPFGAGVLTDGEDGFIVQQEAENRLAVALRNALELDVLDQQRIMDRARHRAMAFDWDRVADQHYSHLFSRVARG